MRRETRNGVLWTTAIAIALVGSFAIEATTSPLTAYPITWPEAEAASFASEGTLSEGGEFVFPTDIPVDNVTRVRARVTWNDPVGDPDTFTVELRGPGGRTSGVVASASGTVVAGLNVSDPPGQRSLAATDRDAARTQAATAFATDDGRGRWEVVVTLEDAPGVRPVPGSDVEAQADGSNDFEVELVVETYRARLDPGS